MIGRQQLALSEDCGPSSATKKIVALVVRLRIPSRSSRSPAAVFSPSNLTAGWPLMASATQTGRLFASDWRPSLATVLFQAVRDGHFRRIYRCQHNDVAGHLVVAGNVAERAQVVGAIAGNRQVLGDCQIAVGGAIESQRRPLKDGRASGGGTQGSVVGGHQCTFLNDRLTGVGIRSR
jgi:hypothetical protein